MKNRLLLFLTLAMILVSPLCAMSGTDDSGVPICGSAVYMGQKKADVYGCTIRMDAAQEGEKNRVEIHTEANPCDIERVILTDGKQNCNCLWGVMDENRLFVEFSIADAGRFDDNLMLYLIVFLKE